MIQRSGFSARSFLPMSAATSRTCATTFLSSVSGMVKNWGAWGSMAPPITVDIITLLLGLPPRIPSPKTILRWRVQQGQVSKLVIAGLDRAIHDLRENFLAKKMDARVKPAHDGVREPALHSRNGSKYGLPNRLAFHRCAHPITPRNRSGDPNGRGA